MIVKDNPQIIHDTENGTEMSFLRKNGGRTFYVCTGTSVVVRDRVR